MRTEPDRLVIAISSRALFDLEESHRVFTEQGIEAYYRYQIEHENDPLARVGFPIERATFAGGSSPHPYTVPFRAHLFLGPPFDSTTRERQVRVARSGKTAEKSKKPQNGATLGYEAELWQMADALRGAMDAADYKHVVLGLLFLEYISDAFEEQHVRLEAEKTQGADPEDPDEYRAVNVFLGPARGALGAPESAGQSTLGKLVDDAMAGIERDNPALKGVLPKDYARPALDKMRLGQLIDLISTIDFRRPSPRPDGPPSPNGRGGRRCLPDSPPSPNGRGGRRCLPDSHPSPNGRGGRRCLPDSHPSPNGRGGGDEGRHAHDLLGRVYEYFLSQFASAEGKKGGEPLQEGLPWCFGASSERLEMEFCS